jgi:hypothetical protein
VRTLLAVLALAVAVIGMHSLGAGHLDMPMPHAHGATSRGHAAGPSPAHTDARAPLMPATAMDARSPSHCSDGGCAAAGHGSHDAAHLMGLICLAVLPVLLTLLLTLLLRRTRPASRVGTVWRLLTCPVRGAPPPPHLSPSLAKLCVLRT